MSGHNNTIERKKNQFCFVKAKIATYCENNNKKNYFSALRDDGS